MQALCGLELRSPRPLVSSEFQAFNQAYVARLKKAGVLMGNQVPVTRTNVAYAHTGASSGEPEFSIHAFSYTMPTARRKRTEAPTFVTAGIPEIRNLQAAGWKGEVPDIVARTDTTSTGLPTPAALRQKTEFILTALDGVMHALGVGWTEVTCVQLYTVHDVQPLVADLILPRLGDAARLGIEWHHTHPPFVQVEVGARGTRLELTI
jgi:hypothetical protein